jgi:hypothetical protein
MHTIGDASVVPPRLIRIANWYSGAWAPGLATAVAGGWPAA